MSDDLVRRLRKRRDVVLGADTDCAEAADEIERLCARLKEAEHECELSMATIAQERLRAQRAEAQVATLRGRAIQAARECFWSAVGGGRIVSRQASPDEVEAAIRAALEEK